MNNTLAAWFIVAALAIAPPAAAQNKAFDGTDLQALKAAAKADKKALVATTIQPTDAQAKKFWPLYDDYQRKLDALNRRNTRLVEEIVAQNRVSDALAKELLKESLAIEDEEIKARRAYQNRLVRVLPAAKVVRYLQLENKIRALQDYEIAAVMPLVN